METKRYALKEILTICSGKDHSNCSDGVFPVYGSGGIMRFIDVYLYAGDSILLPRKGTLSNVQYVSGHFYTVDTCYYTKINKNIVNPYYLFRLLRSMDLSGLDSGASIPSMTTKTYYGIKVDLPDINYQNKIAEIIKKYDELIEKNRTRIKVLEEMSENLYKEWFVRFRFPGHETAEFENGIPKGWEILKIADVANIKAGGDRPVVFSDVPTEECPIPIFSNGLEADGLYGYTDKAIIKNESVTISARGTVGFVCFRRKPYVPIVRLVAVIPKAQTVTPLYLYYYLQRDSVIANGTSQQQITVPMVSRKRMIIPPTSLLQAFDKREYPIWSLTDKLKAQNENLIKQRNLLLPRLMSGKLEV